MCEPTTLAAIGIGASILGTGVSMYGQMQAAGAASAQANYKAAVDRNNQVIADRAAADALLRGQNAEAQKATQTAQALGRARAASAANGVDVNTGSAVDLQSDTAAAGTYDELTIRSNAIREATGYTQQGLNYQSQAGLDEAAGQQAQAASVGAMGSTLLSGAGSVASNWYTFNYGTRQQIPKAA